jgi:hypothetical protein
MSTNDVVLQLFEEFFAGRSIEPAMCGMIAIALRAKDIFDERNRVGTRHDGEVARHADRGGTGSA